MKMGLPSHRVQESKAIFLLGGLDRYHDFILAAWMMRRPGDSGASMIFSTDPRTAIFIKRF